MLGWNGGTGGGLGTSGAGLGTREVYPSPGCPCRGTRRWAGEGQTPWAWGQPPRTPWGRRRAREARGAELGDAELHAGTEEMWRRRPAARVPGEATGGCSCREPAARPGPALC